MKLKKMVLALAGAMLTTGWADPCWNGKTGYIDDEAMWSAKPAPIYSTTTASGGRNYAQVYTKNSWDSTMYLKELAIFNGGFSIGLFPETVTSLAFDGADVTLVHGDVPTGMNDRSANNVFFCENGSGTSYRWFDCDVGSKRHAAYLWSNVLFRVDHTSRVPGSTDCLAALNTITFGRGYALWGGTNLTDMAGTTTFGAGESSGFSSAMVVTNSTVVFNALNWIGKVGETSLAVSGTNATLEVLTHAYFGLTSSATLPGTNSYVVSDGATVRINRGATATADTFIGPSTTSPQVHVFTVTGKGSLLDYGTSNRGMWIKGGGRLVVTNGGTVRVNGSISVGKVAGNPGGVIRVTGDGSSLEFGEEGVTGESVLVVDATADSTFMQDGGQTKINMTTSAGKKKLSVYLGQSAGNAGTFRLSGGTFDMGDNAGDMRVGMCGSGLLEVSGGKLIGCNSLAVGERGGASGETTNAYRQTGGVVEAYGTGLTCNQGTDPTRHISIELLGGTTSVYRASGGAAVSTPELSYAGFSANGGTLQTKSDGCYHKTYPFLYGFNEVELGPKGLTLVLRAKSNVTQRFTDREDETGRLYVEGPATSAAYFDAPDGGDNAELVIGAIPVFIENAMTNWQTRVVVTNGATFNVSAVGNLALKGLALGNADSSGTLVLAPTNRLTLSEVSFANVKLSLAGTYATETDYPFLTVRGRVDEASGLAWKFAAVTGSVPSGCVPRLRASYSSADDETTLSVRFVVATAPSVENVWQGAAGGQNVSWDDPNSWSHGVPDETSIVTLSSDASSVTSTVTVASALSTLGALAISGLRDYIVSGDGSLFFENCGAAASIAVSGGDQRIDAPVYAIQDVSVSVAEDARLTFGESVQSSTGSLLVNSAHEKGRVILQGEGSSFKTGITHGGGVLEATSAVVFGSGCAGTSFKFRGLSMLKVNGDPSDDPYRLPFGFQFYGGSAAGSGVNWGSVQCIDNDRALVVPPYVTEMPTGACLAKRGRAPLVFEAKADSVLTLANANGGNSWENAKLPNGPFAVNENTGVIEKSGSCAGVSVCEGELVYRGTDDVTPSASVQALKNGFGVIIGQRTTNDVEAVPGLVLDRVYANFGETKLHSSAKSDTSYVSLAQDPYDIDYPRLATNAYLIVSNKATLATGYLYVGNKTFETQGFMDNAPRITVDDSTLRTVTGLDFAAQPKTHATWDIHNGASLLTGTNSAVWNGEVRMTLSGSMLAGTADGSNAKIALGASAYGALNVSTGSVAKIGTVMATDGAAVTFAFDGGELAGLANGGMIGFPSAVTLRADAGGLILNVPQGETWTLAKDVTGAGCVTLNGAGTLALSGTVSAGFAGSGTVSGGTLGNGRIGVDVTGAAGTPTFADVSLDGRITVDLGLGRTPQTKPYPANVRVATFTGKVPPASAFRVVNAGTGVDGRRLHGDVAVDANGVVTVTLCEKGLVLVFR